jgi:hypothetical protein
MYSSLSLNLFRGTKSPEQVGKYSDTHTHIHTHRLVHVYTDAHTYLSFEKHCCFITLEALSTSISVPIIQNCELGQIDALCLNLLDIYILCPRTIHQNRRHTLAIRSALYDRDLFCMEIVRDY